MSGVPAVLAFLPPHSRIAAPGSLSRLSNNMPTTTKTSIAPPVEPRCIVVNELGPHLAHKKFKGNRVSTTKYNLLTYLPKALYEQYRQAARGTNFPPQHGICSLALFAERIDNPAGGWQTYISPLWQLSPPPPSALSGRCSLVLEGDTSTFVHASYLLCAALLRSSH